jgi:hypothetical protein
MKRVFCIALLAFAVAAGRSHSSAAASGGGGSDNSGSGSAGSIVGRVKFTGEAPKPARISMSTDPSCAKLHSGPVLNDDFVVGNDGSLGNVVVFISDGLGNRTFDPPAETAVVEQKGCVYHRMWSRCGPTRKCEW